MERNYGIALREKEGNEGLDRADVYGLYEMLEGSRVYTVEISAREHESYAIGFITEEAAEMLGFEYGEDSRLGEFIAGILDDMDKERDDCTYVLDGVNIWLSR